MNKLVASKFIARIGIWSALAFVLNLVWEIGHIGLYTLWGEAAPLVIVWSIFHCTLGDVLIALGVFAFAAIVFRRVDWPMSHRLFGGALAVVAALVFTAQSEWYNVYRSGAWGYSSSMPTIFGIGLSPLLQWLILLPAMVVAHRALEPLLVRQKSANSISSNETKRSVK